jgi:hypothetical protein
MITKIRTQSAASTAFHALQRTLFLKDNPGSGKEEDISGKKAKKRSLFCFMEISCMIELFFL